MVRKMVRFGARRRWLTLGGSIYYRGKKLWIKGRDRSGVVPFRHAKPGGEIFYSLPDHRLQSGMQTFCMYIGRIEFLVADQPLPDYPDLDDAPRKWCAKW